MKKKLAILVLLFIPLMLFGCDETIDNTSGAVVGIDEEHYEIHIGNHYYISGFEVENNAGTIIFGFTTSQTGFVHMTFEVNGTSRTEFAVYEGSTISDGSNVTPLNNYRNSTNISGMTVVKDPTVNAAGTLIFSGTRGLEGVGINGGNIDEFSRHNEIILAQGTIYTFVITSRDDTNHISYVGDWYEE